MLSWILVIIVVSLCLGLGGIVYFKNPKEKINKIFIVLVFLVIIWILSNYLENEPIDPALASLFLRIDFASAALLVYFFFLFTINFQGNFLIPSAFKQALASLPALILFALSFSNLIITRIGFENNTISFEKGPLFPLYAILLFGYVTTGCGDLISKYKKLKNIERIQTLYVLLGFSLSAFIALIINLFFQNLLPVNMFRIGNYGVFFFIGFTTFAILRHHLLEIKVILTELLIGLIAVLLLIQALLFKTLSEFSFKIILFLVFLYFGYLLIKSVLQEIKKREELEIVTKKLEKAYQDLQKSARVQDPRELRFPGAGFGVRNQATARRVLTTERSERGRLCCGR